MQELLSIVVPAFNVEKLLKKTLDSILAQTYLNIEVIVINDGSTDNTGIVIDKCAIRDSRIKAIHKENGGVTSARLAGVKVAKGEWIGFVDGDDYIEPDMYEKLIANAVKYNADISHCGYKMVFPNRQYLYYGTGKLLVQDNLQGLKDLISGVFVEPGVVNKIYRKSLMVDFVNEGKMDSKIKINEDLLMNYYLFKKSSLSVYEDYCPYHYIVRKGSAANSDINESKIKDPLRVLQIINKDIQKTELFSVAFKRYLRQLIVVATMSLGKQREWIKSYRKYARKELRRQLLKATLMSGIGVKLKIMAMWASMWPASYGWIHRMYEKMTGIDKIYNFE